MWHGHICSGRQYCYQCQVGFCTINRRQENAHGFLIWGKLWSGSYGDNMVNFRKGKSLYRFTNMIKDLYDEVVI